MAQTTVLVVDDDQDFRLQQKVNLEKAGYTVVEADNREDALAAAQETQPDIAVIDLMMEEADAGFVLCYQLKQVCKEIPVVIVTAVASETGMEFGADTNEERSWIKADALLAKPIRFEQLQKEIVKLLGE